jgi:heterodisulfide reductase subunit C
MTVCPKGVDLARIMEAIRMLQLRKGENEIELRKLDKDYLERAPQIALISGSRKFLSLA